MTRVLIVDDEPDLAEPLEFLLRRDGFDTVIAADGPTALAELDLTGADLVLLDLMLPGMPGTEVCTRIRAGGSRVPIIMVTARDTELDRVLGLELGADDYVTKPYSARELTARIRTVLRRSSPTPRSTDTEPDVLHAGPLTMDTERHHVTLHGTHLTLPLKEFQLLEYLMRNAGLALTRHQLIDRVWGADYIGDTKTLDVHVKRLRTKIEADRGAPQRLITIRGLGYQLKT